MPLTTLTVRGAWSEPPSRYEVTVRVVGKDDGHPPDPAAFAAAAMPAASSRNASVVSAHTAEEVIWVVGVTAPIGPLRLLLPWPSSPTRSGLGIRPVIQPVRGRCPMSCGGSKNTALRDLLRFHARHSDRARNNAGGQERQPDAGRGRERGLGKAPAARQGRFSRTTANARTARCGLAAGCRGHPVRQRVSNPGAHIPTAWHRFSARTPI